MPCTSHARHGGQGCHRIVAIVQAEIRLWMRSQRPRTARHRGSMVCVRGGIRRPSPHCREKRGIPYFGTDNEIRIFDGLIIDHYYRFASGASRFIDQAECPHWRIYSDRCFSFEASPMIQAPGNYHSKPRGIHFKALVNVKFALTSCLQINLFTRLTPFSSLASDRLSIFRSGFLFSDYQPRILGFKCKGVWYF